MSYTNPDTMTEIANILEDLDEDILRDLFKSQIISDENYTNLQVNHFQPLHYSYKRAMSMDGVEEDDIANIKTRYFNICISIIKFILEKYQLEIDESWVNDKYGSVPSLAMGLYQFFVLDIFHVILESLNNFITKNLDTLYNAFIDIIQNKDVSISTNLKIMDPKHAVIASCIYDVTDYSFSMMDPESFFDYIDNKYVPGLLVGKLIKDGIITGDFVNVLASIYKDNLVLRSRISFELVYRIKERGYLQYNSIIVHRDNLNDKNQETDSSVNVDIEDDVD